MNRPRLEKRRGLRALPRKLLRHAANLVAPPSLLVTRGPGKARRVALTFDDGPDATTGAYLDVLERYGVRCTFFVLGEACAAHPEALIDIVRRGHELAHHGYQHLRFPTLSFAEIGGQLRRTAELLPAPRGTRPMVRPPGGATSLASLAACAAAGYQTLLWSLDSDDSRTRDAADVIATLAPEHLRPGEIVLLHEGQAWTLAALGPVIEGLRAAGYRLCTVSELLAGTDVEGPA